MSNKFISLILNLLFPPRCASCRREGEFLCEECVKKFKIKDLRFTNKKYQPQKEFLYLDGVIYGLDYAENPEIQAALKQFKYKFTQELADYFGELLSDKLRQLSMTKNKQIVLIPVPLHKKRLNYRGFNQAELITGAIAEKMGDRVSVVPVLRRVKNTSQQAKLNKKERQKNLEEAFRIDDRIKNQFENNMVYFIVDDVCTTGSTLENCAKILKEAGLKKVYGLTVARAFK